MKLIRSGGVDNMLTKDDSNFNKYGFGNYFMLQIKHELNRLIKEGRTIAICVAAKPNKNHYDQSIIDIGFNINDFTMLGRQDNAGWDEYDAVLMLGGETIELHSWLQRTKFSLEKLKKCQLLAGDSAGAYVLSGKTLYDYTPDGDFIDIINGYLPNLNQLIAAHVNNPRYHKPGLTKALRKWCAANNVDYIEILEDELIYTEI